MFNHNAGITLVKHLVARLIQLPLSLHSGVRLAKRKTEHKEKTRALLWLQKMRGKRLMKIFARGMFFKAAEVEQGAGKHRETDVQAVKTAQLVLCNLGTCPPTF